VTPAVTRRSVLGRERGPIVVGHRGGRGDGWPPENTLAAFEQARRQGAHAVELDVRLCKSGEVVVLHDPTLARMTGGRETRAATELSWSELAGIDLANSFERVPRLSDVVRWAEAASCALNVEMKHDVPSRLVLARAVARDLSDAGTPLLVSSFDPLLLAAFRAHAPRTPSALLTDPKQSYASLFHAAAHPWLITALHVERRQALPSRVERWRRRGLFVGVWTVNDPREASDLAHDGVDVLITDEPARILGALSDRG
jgi:glycerophosphoryl diester phosphodiesterase